MPQKFVYDDVVGPHAEREYAVREGSNDPRTGSIPQRLGSA
jgi:hypothetical protein